MSVELISITPDAETLIGYCARVSSPQNQGNDAAKLLRYCIKHGHWSPFEMAHMVVGVETTRQISAQMIRHRSFAFQEFSQRYASVQNAPVLPVMRLSGATNRQSSRVEPLNGTQRAIVERANALMNLIYKSYEQMIEHGIARESARAVLPMCSYTKLYMAGSIRSFLHYCQVRMTEDTQVEHREIAEAIAKLLEEQVPVIWDSFIKHHAGYDSSISQSS